MPENNADKDSGQTISRQEAEDRVAAMLNSARSARKPARREKRSQPRVIDLPQPVLREIEHTSDKDSIKPVLPAEEAVSAEKTSDETIEEISVHSEIPDHELTPEEAEEKVAEMLAVAQTSKRSSKSRGMSGEASEIILLELISFSLFFICIKSRKLLDFAPAAIFLPVIIGIGYRLVFRQLTLKEAASRCKPHMILSAFFYLMLLLSV
ncbi:MAG: hypothetical protein IKO47_01290 [Ruminococcus sp.]|nr:hypothetical protein [Ruminococcus sp.]